MDVRYERFCFPVTFRCNLSCELCAEHAPYAKKPYHPQISELTKQLDQLFELTEHIGKMDITGGEPFLRKDLPDILDYLYDHFRDKIGTLRVTTNGTLLPPARFLEAASRWNEQIYVIVDNYAVSARSSEVYSQIQAAAIPSEQRDYSENLHCDGWVDYGDLSLKHSRQEAEQLFRKCMVPKLGFFTCMVNGFIFPCARARLLYEHLIRDVTMDLSDPELTQAGKKARMRALLEDEVIDACRYCNGLCEDSPRFPPAKQLAVPREQAYKFVEYEDWRLRYGKVLIYTQTYNNEKTIARTIESVLNQTNRDFTYFICNNGSTDRTGEIIRKYAEADRTGHIVFVECEKNDILGVIAIPGHLFSVVPRYLDHYFTIVDGDDSIEPDFLEQIQNLISGQELDMIVSSVNRINAKTGEIINRRGPETNLVVSGRQKADEFMTFRPLILTQWGKVHRWKSYRKCTNVMLYKYTLQVPKWFYTADAVAALSYFYQYNAVGFAAKSGYNYYISPESVFHGYFPDRVKADVLMFKINNDFLEKFPPVSQCNRDYCYAIYLSLLEDTLRSILRADKVSDQQKLSDILDILKQETTQNLFSGDFDPIFQNLAHRESFTDSIREYVDGLPTDMVEHELRQQIYLELDRCDEHPNEMEPEADKQAN